MSKGLFDLLLDSRFDDELLLLSKYAICHKAYNEVLKDVTWSTCSLRNWLNTEYLVQAFSAEEQELIADTNVHNDDDAWTGAPGGEDTVDKVFVLSIEEAQKYFEDNDSRITTFPDGEEASWWLRTPRSQKYYSRRYYYLWPHRSPRRSRHLRRRQRRR